MTAKNVVTDEVFGKFAKMFWVLMGRIMDGSADRNRAYNLLELALQKTSESKSSTKTYVLESEWTFDHVHHEYATISLEECDSQIAFEDVLNPSVSRGDVNYLLMLLKKIFDAQIPKHGGYKMLRVYRVLYESSPHAHGHTNIDGTADLHFVMKPLFDFDDKENPIPCSPE